MVLESVRPNLQSIQLCCWHVLQHTDPLSRDQEAGIAVRDDLDCVPLWYVTDGLRPHGQRIGDLSALSLQLCTRLRSAGPELQSRSAPNTLLPNG